MPILRSLLDRHKVSGACDTASGKSLTALLLLMLVCKRHNYRTSDLEREGNDSCQSEAKVAGLLLRPPEIAEALRTETTAPRSYTASSTQGRQRTSRVKDVTFTHEVGSVAQFLRRARSTLHETR